jgi:hypothetical protein
MSNDPHGYIQLYDVLLVISSKLRILGRGESADRIFLATQFRGGSPTEFLGESRLALQATLDSERDLPSDIVAEIQNTLEEVNEGFDRAGYR